MMKTYYMKLLKHLEIVDKTKDDNIGLNYHYQSNKY